MTEDTTNHLKLALGLAAAGAVLLAADAFLLEPALVEVTEQALPVSDLPPAWSGARVVHLTDLHYGDPRCERLFRWMVETVNALEPDLIVITGDFILKSPREVAPCARHLARLRSRRGIVAVLGDHDFNLRTKRLIRGMPEELEKIGMRFLRNSAVELPGGLRLAGTDPATFKLHYADMDRALAPLAGEAPHLLLSHSPDILPEAARRGVPLVLCGHTHGGQVVVPFFGPPITHTHVHRRHASGWSTYGGTRAYTGRGLASHHSLRFCCRPEIAVFTLERAENPGGRARDEGTRGTLAAHLP